MPRRVRSWCLAILLAGFAIPARADFVISIGSATVPQGGTGTVDVFLNSTAGSSSPDLLNNLAFTLQITGPHELQFTSTQNFSYLNGSQYVFFGDSTDQKTSSPDGTVKTTVYANDTFAGSDSTFSSNPVSLSSSSGQVLLASLSLNTAITNVGDSYTISLVPPTGSGSMNSSTSTFFDDFNFSTGAETSAVPFTNTPETVTITASAIPEPATIVLGLTAVPILSGVYRVRCLRTATGRWVVVGNAVARVPHRVRS
jgi:hypothetical protein